MFVLAWSYKTDGGETVDKYYRLETQQELLNAHKYVKHVHGGNLLTWSVSSEISAWEEECEL